MVRAAMLAVVLLPVAYLSILFSTVVHEALGHGMTAVLLGGTFDEMVLRWDGMGWAVVEPAPAAPAWHHVTILAAGVVATTVVGLALFVVARLIPRGYPLPRPALLAPGLACLLEGPTYAFWNAYHPVPPGDIGRILHTVESAGPTRYAIMAAGAAVSLAATVYGLAAIRSAVVTFVGRGRPLSRRQDAVLFALFAAAPVTTGWLLFDWDQLAPGIGHLPAIVGILATLLAAVGLYLWGPVRDVEGDRV